jgi:F-type H+-transporting ATPase subunit delta
MNHSKISVRYAKALFLTAKENNELENVRKDIEYIQSLFNEIHLLKYTLSSPVIKTSHKLSIINEVFKNSICSFTLRFLELIIKNKRELHIQDISRNFIDSYKKFKGIRTVTLTTAYKIDEETKQILLNKITKSINEIVELHENVNPEIIGGFILKIEDQQYDSSVTSKLLHIKRKLVSN